MARTPINITLSIAELKYDIFNRTYLTGRSRSTGNNGEQVADMQADEQEENLNQILRTVGNSLNSLMSQLNEYAEVPATTNADNVLESGGTDINIKLLVPSNFAYTSTKALATEIHQYIVNSAIAEWFSITNKDESAEYATLAVANLQMVKNIINKRVRPTRTAPVERY